MPLRRRSQTSGKPEREAESEPEGFPAHVLSSVYTWLAPFFRGDGHAQDSGDGFLRAVERNLRETLNWRNGQQSAGNDLFERMHARPELLVAVVDFALRNITFGYLVMEVHDAAKGLDRFLHEAGAAWRVHQDPQSIHHFWLERRVDPATTAARDRIGHTGTAEGGHLLAAFAAAYGRSPNPTEAYRQAVKAVEQVAVPVVLPNDSSATLGKVIGELRAAPSNWTCSLTRNGMIRPQVTVAPIEVLIGMLDLLWKNQTDRHAPEAAITPSQAEVAVNLAIPLVEIFRSGAIAKV